MSKPTSKPDWTFTNPDAGTIAIEPSTQKKIAGWFADERPSFKFFNWLFRNISEWIDYIEEVADTVGSQTRFDATVGAGAQFSDINALMISPDIDTIKEVLITSLLPLATLQDINADDMVFTFKAGAGFIKNTASQALVVSGNRNTINSPVFINFDDVSDIALQLTGNNNIVDFSRFRNVRASGEYDDQGTNNIFGANNMVEV